MLKATAILLIRRTILYQVDRQFNETNCAMYMSVREAGNVKRLPITYQSHGDTSRSLSLCLRNRQTSVANIHSIINKTRHERSPSTKRHAI